MKPSMENNQALSITEAMSQLAELLPQLETAHDQSTASLGEYDCYKRVNELLSLIFPITESSEIQLERENAFLNFLPSPDKDKKGSPWDWYSNPETEKALKFFQGLQSHIYTSPSTRTAESVLQLLLSRSTPEFRKKFFSFSPVIQVFSAEEWSALFEKYRAELTTNTIFKDRILHFAKEAGEKLKATSYEDYHAHYQTINKGDTFPRLLQIFFSNEQWAQELSPNDHPYFFTFIGREKNYQADVCYIVALVKTLKNEFPNSYPLLAHFYDFTQKDFQTLYELSFYKPTLLKNLNHFLTERWKQYETESSTVFRNLQSIRSELQPLDNLFASQGKLDKSAQSKREELAEKYTRETTKLSTIKEKLTHLLKTLSQIKNTSNMSLLGEILFFDYSRLRDQSKPKTFLKSYKKKKSSLLSEEEKWDFLTSEDYESFKKRFPDEYNVTVKEIINNILSNPAIVLFPENAENQTISLVASLKTATGLSACFVSYFYDDLLRKSDEDLTTFMFYHLERMSSIIFPDGISALAKILIERKTYRNHYFQPDNSHPARLPNHIAYLSNTDLVALAAYLPDNLALQVTKEESRNIAATNDSPAKVKDPKAFLLEKQNLSPANANFDAILLDSNINLINSLFFSTQETKEVPLTPNFLLEQEAQKPILKKKSSTLSEQDKKKKRVKWKKEVTESPLLPMENEIRFVSPTLNNDQLVQLITALIKHPELEYRTNTVKIAYLRKLLLQYAHQLNEVIKYITDAETLAFVALAMKQTRDGNRAAYTFLESLSPSAKGHLISVFSTALSEGTKSQDTISSLLQLVMDNIHKEGKWEDVLPKMKGPLPLYLFKKTYNNVCTAYAKKYSLPHSRYDTYKIMVNSAPSFLPIALRAQFKTNHALLLNLAFEKNVDHLLTSLNLIGFFMDMPIKELNSHIEKKHFSLLQVLTLLTIDKHLSEKQIHAKLTKTVKNLSFTAKSIIIDLIQAQSLAPELQENLFFLLGKVIFSTTKEEMPPLLEKIPKKLFIELMLISNTKQLRKIAPILSAFNFTEKKELLNTLISSHYPIAETLARDLKRDTTTALPLFLKHLGVVPDATWFNLKTILGQADDSLFYQLLSSFSPNFSEFSSQESTGFLRRILSLKITPEKSLSLLNSFLRADPNGTLNTIINNLYDDHFSSLMHFLSQDSVIKQHIALLQDLSINKKFILVESLAKDRKLTPELLTAIKFEDLQEKNPGKFEEIIRKWNIPLLKWAAHQKYPLQKTSLSTKEFILHMLQGSLEEFSCLGISPDMNEAEFLQYVSEASDEAFEQVLSLVNKEDAPLFAKMSLENKRKVLARVKDKPTLDISHIRMYPEKILSYLQENQNKPLSVFINLSRDERNAVLDALGGSYASILSKDLQEYSDNLPLSSLGIDESTSFEDLESHLEVLKNLWQSDKELMSIKLKILTFADKIQKVLNAKAHTLKSLGEEVPDVANKLDTLFGPGTVSAEHFTSLQIYEFTRHSSGLFFSLPLEKQKEFLQRIITDTKAASLLVTQLFHSDNNGIWGEELSGYFFDAVLDHFASSKKLDDINQFIYVNADKLSDISPYLLQSPHFSKLSLEAQRLCLVSNNKLRSLPKEHFIFSPGKNEANNPYPEFLQKIRQPWLDYVDKKEAPSLWSPLTHLFNKKRQEKQAVYQHLLANLDEYYAKYLEQARYISITNSNPETVATEITKLDNDFIKAIEGCFADKTLQKTTQTHRLNIKKWLSEKKMPVSLTESEQVRQKIMDEIIKPKLRK